MTDRWTNARTDGHTENNVSLAHPNHEGTPSGLGGDSVTDKWTDYGCTDGRIEK